MRTTVTLDEDVFEAAQAQARASGKSLGQVLSVLARRGLQSTARRAPGKGLPAFEVRPGSDIIPTSRAKTMLDEDPA